LNIGHVCQSHYKIYPVNVNVSTSGGIRTWRGCRYGLEDIGQAGIGSSHVSSENAGDAGEIRIFEINYTEFFQRIFGFVPDRNSCFPIHHQCGEKELFLPFYVLFVIQLAENPFFCLAPIPHYA